MFDGSQVGLEVPGDNLGVIANNFINWPRTLKYITTDSFEVVTADGYFPNVVNYLGLPIRLRPSDAWDVIITDNLDLIKATSVLRFTLAVIAI